ncbi:hypothetical protein ACEPAG_8034 [Sanghuangporus baumii]
MSFTLSSLAVLVVSALHVLAESHTIRFQNNCGTGTPKLIKGATVLSSGEDYTSNGPIESSIAYLDRNNECGFNGEHCTLVEMNMNNPSCPGCGSSVDISLIPDHAFNVETAFTFYGGDGDTCDGLGAICADAKCNTAFFAPDDNQVQRACQANNVNLLITFCGASTTKFTEAVAGSMSGGSSSSGSGSSGSSKAASPSSTEVSTPSSSETASPAASSPASSANSITSRTASADSSQPTVVNVGDTGSNDPSSSPVTSASGASPTCSRKRSTSRSRRAKRTSSFSRHSRAQARARALSGFHDSKL